MIRQEIFKQMRKNRLLLLGVIYLSLRAASALLFHVYPSMARGTSAFSSGDAVFFTRQNIDWLLTALTAYVSVCVWVTEYASEMQAFHLTAKHGRASLFCIKFMLILVFPALLSLLGSCMEYGIGLLRFGYTEVQLSAMGVQYQTAARTGMVRQYSLLMIPLKALGTASFSALVSLAALIIRKILPVLLSALALILVPVYLLPSSDLRCRLCLPVSLLQGKELWRGSLLWQDSFGETQYHYREITNAELLRNAAVQLIIIALCFALCRLLYLQKTLRIRRFAGAVPLILSVFLMTGCSTALPEMNTPQYLALSDGVTVYSKKDQSVFSVNPTPLTDYKIAAVYGEYALVTEQLTDAAMSFTVSLVHLPDLTKTDLLTVGRSTYTDGLLGLDDLIEVPPAWRFDFHTYGMNRQIKLDGTILYGKAEDAVVSFDLAAGKRTEWLSGETFYAPMMRDGMLYYLDESHTLCRTDNAGQTESLASAVADYRLCPQSVCYISDGTVYRLTEDGSKQKMSEDPADYFLFCDDTHIVFVTQDVQTVAIGGDTVRRYDQAFQYADECCLYQEADELHVVRYD